jgi:hypothetical protein
MANPAIEILYKNKLKLEGERDEMYYRLSEEIKGIDTAIEILSGKKVWEVESEMEFDDLKPDYIKGSEDGI